MPVGLQPSLAGGELSPSLYARVDLTKYKTGAKLLENFIIHPHGGISNRSGTQYIGLTTRQDILIYLTEFVAASDDAYILEWGDGYMRPWRNGLPVIAPNGQPYVLSTPWSVAQIREASFAQSNDVLTVVHPNANGIYEIQRYAHNDWRLIYQNFSPAMTAPTSITVTATIGFNTPPAAGQSNGYVPRNYAYRVTAISKETGEESLPGPGAFVANQLGYAQNYNTIDWPAVAGADRYNVYKAENGLYGLIGSTRNTSFKDDNIKANLQESPPTTDNPFSGGNWPSVVTYHQGRRWFGSTPKFPQTLYATQSASFNNMTKSIPLRDSDAIEVTLAARQIQKILHLVPLDEMLVFTKSAEWKLFGPKDGIITTSSISAKPQSYYGAAAKPDPIIIGSQVLFVQAKGQTIRDIGYRFDVDKYTGDDLSILAKHLTKGRKIIDWAYAQVPDSIIWMALDDGTVLTLTYMREHEVWGWARMKFPGAKVESVACVPDTGYDAVYFSMRRNINGRVIRTIEKLTDRIGSRQGWFVDCGLRYTSPDIQISAITRDSESKIVITAPNHGLVEDEDVLIRTDLSALTGYTLDGTFWISDVTQNTFRIKDFRREYLRQALPIDSQGGRFYVRRKVNTITGLDHLEGASVVGVADGGVVGMGNELVVTNGTIVLQDSASDVILGLGYEARFESLELTMGDANVLPAIKNVIKSAVMVDATQGIELGHDWNTLQEMLPREFEQMGMPPFLKNTKISLPPPDGWDDNGRICVRQRYPLPCTILALVPEIMYAKD